MRVIKGSPVSTASTEPDFSASLMVGNVTSTKLTLFGSTPLSISHLRKRTCRKAPMPGAPTFLPLKSLASLIVTPVRATAAIASLETGSMDEAPSIATRSSPPSTACRNTVAVGPPIWIESETIAGGMLLLIAIRVTSASIPCLAKMPSSPATIAEAQSLVAVQAIFSLKGSARAEPAARAKAAVATNNPIPRYIPILSSSFCRSSMRPLIIDKTYDRIYPGGMQAESQMKLATYQSSGAVRVGLVEADEGRLFDLSAAARRAGAPEAPFASM